MVIAPFLQIFFCLLALTLPWRMHMVQVLLVHSWNQHGWSYLPSHCRSSSTSSSLAFASKAADLSKSKRPIFWRLELHNLESGPFSLRNQILIIGLMPGISFNVMKPMVQFCWFIPCDFTSVHIHTLTAGFCYMISGCNTPYTPICT